MGGFHSGRTRRHSCIDDCLELDTAWLRKQKILGKERHSFSLIWKKWTETNFSTRRESEHLVRAHYHHSERPTLTLEYQVKVTYSDYRPSRERSYSETIRLVSTPCHYGGERWWFTCPCCSARVRVLYINPKRGELERMTPQCRTCLDLHYASQLQSYIEHHKTYERYLLANYGYTWAKVEYDYKLKEHYFKVTLEWAEIAARSEFDRSLELMRHLIRSNRVMLKHDIRALCSLKSEEDKRTVLAFLLEHRGESYVLEMFRLMGIPAETVEHKKGTFEQEYLAAVAADTPEHQDITRREPLSLHALIERKRDMMHLAPAA